jgi:hypothetical protein
MEEEQTKLIKQLEAKCHRLRQQLEKMETRQAQLISLQLVAEGLLQNFPPTISDMETKKDYLRLMRNKAQIQMAACSIQKQQQLAFQLAGVEGQLQFLRLS